jgi:hypothetical protein
MQDPSNNTSNNTSSNNSRTPKAQETCCFQHEAIKSNFFLELNCKERKTCNVHRRWPCNGRREHLEILSNYGGNSVDKGILEKLKRERKGLTFYTVANKLKP